jgi:hypothetical protein
MKILLAAFVIVFALVLISMAVPSAEAAPLYQETATPTVTPVYVIENTVSVGEYGIATILSAQCLLLIIMATGAALWGYMQKRSR